MSAAWQVRWITGSAEHVESFDTRWDAHVYASTLRAAYGDEDVPVSVQYVGPGA